MSLVAYKKKRVFSDTPEPKGAKAASTSSRFVVQRHDASRLHYDFRLELGGVLKSWAVPKGPSLFPADKRLAVMVEDHPVDYIGFKGTIPQGNYGAGSVKIWDKGNYRPIDEEGKAISEKQALKNLKGGMIKFYLKGKLIKGEFVLVKLKTDPAGKNWLLIKHKDEFAVDHPYNSEDYAKTRASKKEPKKKTAKKTNRKKA